MAGRSGPSYAGVDSGAGHCPFVAPVPIDPEYDMFKWAVTLALIATLAGVLGFSGLAASIAGVAKMLFLLFMLAFVAVVMTIVLGVNDADR